MTLLRPEALLVILLVPVVLWWHRRGRDDSPALSPAVAALRVLLLALLTLALAQPVLTGEGTPRVRVVLADVSDSMGSLADVQAAVDQVLAAAEPAETVRLVAFAGAARELDAAPRDPRRFEPLARDGLRPERSRLERAVDLALACIPAGAGGAVTLVSDGRQSAGEVRDAVGRLTARSIPLDVLIAGARAPQPVLEPVALPCQARVGTSIAVRVAVGAATDGVLEARLTGVEPPAPEKRVAIAIEGGRGEAAITHELEQEGVNRLRLVLHDLDGEVIPGTARTLAVYGLPPRRVWLVEEDEAPSMAGPLARLLGPGARVIPKPASALDGREDLDRVDHLVLADVPATSLEARFLDAVETAVEQGMGLLVTGGERSFGPGGYAGTRLEEILPVRFQQKEERRDPSATLVIIIDTSGSMGGARIQLAKEVARLALRRLKPHDKAGIVEFHGAKRWAAPIQAASNAVDLQRALNRLNAGGGTVILPAIEEAHYALLNVRTRTRHVLVLTDGGVEQGPFEPLVRGMAEKGMTVSTVLVGPGTHSAFLVSLAQWGRGRYYHAPDRFNMPEVIVKQPESSLLSPAIEEPVGVQVVGDSFVAREVALEPAVRLHGVLEVEARSTADVLLETGRGEPLLCRWSYGLGRVAAWMSQLSGPWSRELAASEGYARLLTGLVQEGGRPRRPGEIALRALAARDRVAVFAWAEPDGSLPEGLAVRLEEGPEAAPRTREQPWLAAAGSGREAPCALRFDGVSAGVARLAVVDAEGRALSRGALGIAPEREWTAVAPERARLAELARVTGGRADGGLTPVPARPLAVGHPLWRTCLAAALGVFLLLVLVRRLAPRRPSRRAGSAAALLACVLGLAVLAAGAVGAQETAAPAGELPAEARDGVVAALEAGPDSPRGASALDAAMRACRLEDGHLDRLLAALEKRAAAADPRAARLLARVACADGRPERALELMEQLDAAGALDGAGLAELARVLEMLGREAPAVAVLERALAGVDDPALRIALRLRKASLLLSQGEDAGLEPLREILADHPGQPDLHFYVALLGALYGRPELFAGFEARAEETDEERGTTPVAFRDHLFLGTFALRTGDHHAAGEHFLQAMQAATLTRDRRYAQERLIAAHRAAGTLGALADEWLAAANRTPERVDALIAVLRELRRPEEALRLLLAGEGLGPEAAERERPFRSLQREIIGLALECNRPEEVEGTYRALIRREPVRTEWRSGLALLHLLRGEREEAAAVFRQGAEAAGRDGKQVLRLAQAARTLSLDEEARHAAGIALELDRDARLRGALLLADIDRMAGRVAAALARLRTVEEEFADSDEALAQVSDAYERMNRFDESVRVLERIAERSAAEDVLMRLAWLLQEQHKIEPALEIWKQLWRTTSLAARVRQAEDRLLDLTSNTGRLADLAIDLEEALEAGEGETRELGLLVKLYMRASDAVSAIEVLRTFAPRLGANEAEALQTMARVYQHCMDYRRYEETLTRLQEVDPENAIDYQQQIAIGALERGRGRQAKRALERLQAIAPDDVLAEEFAAGVLAMVGLMKESVQAYTRVLARHPDRIEDHLLLGNVMRDDGRRDQALRMFLDLLERADQDDLFTVAVDGLLNLGADRATLRVAERRVKERIAQRPSKAFLFQLAADLAEELRNPEAQVSMTALMAVVAGERRSAILREVMEMEEGRRRPEGVIDAGRSVLALGEEMPPQVFLDLGRALIRSGDLATAERVFARTRIAGDFAAMQRQIAGYYEEAGHVGDAARILRQALLAAPDDVELLARVGLLAEVAGDRKQARRDFTRAMDELVKRSPGAVGEPRQAAPEPAAPGGVPGVRATASTSVRMGAAGVGRTVVHSSFARSRNVAEFDRFAPAVTAGLLANQDATSGAALLADLESRIARELAARRESGELRERLQDNPRLALLLSLLRRAALAFEQPGAADRVDRAVLAEYPGDSNERRNAVRMRMNQGLARRAAELAAALEMDLAKDFRSLYLDRLVAEQGGIEKYLAEEKTPGASRIAVLLPRLLTAGRVAEARRLLEAARADTKDFNLGTARTLAMVAIALGDEPAVREWADRWLESIGRTTHARSIPGQLQSFVEVLWGRWSTEERAAFVARLEALAAGAGDEKRAAIEGFLLSLRARLGRETSGSLEVLERMVEQTRGTLSGLRSLLALAPAEHRARLIQKALGGLNERSRRNQILSLASGFPFPLDEASVAAIARTFEETRPDRDFPESAYLYQVPRLAAASACPELALRLVRALGREQRGQHVIGLAEAVLEHRAGRAEKAREKLAAALQAIAKRGRLEHGEQAILQQAIRDPDGGLAAEIERLAPELGGEHAPVRVLLESAVLCGREQLGAAAARLREAYERQPDDSAIRRQLVSVLQALGRLAEVAEIEARWLSGQIADNTYQYRSLAAYYRELERPLEALEAVRKVKPGQVDVLEVALLDQLGREEAARQAFRRFVAQTRDRRIYVSAVWPAPLGKGGLAGPEVEDEGARVIFGQGSDPRRLVYWQLADRPWAEEELVCAWRAGLSPQSRDAGPILASLAETRFRRLGAEETTRHLADRLSSDDLFEIDVELLLRLTGDGRKPLPAALAPALARLGEHVLMKGEQETGLMHRLAALYASHGNLEAARCLYRYLLTSRLGQSYFRDGTSALALVDAYAVTFPEAERSERVRELMAQWEGLLLSSPTHTFDKVEFLLDGWEKTGDVADIEQCAAAIRAVLDELPDYSARSAGAQRLRARLAILHARRGEMDRFAEALREILAQASETGAGLPVSLAALLPEPAQAREPARTAALLEEGFARLAKGAALARVRIRLAGWLVRAGDREAARAMMERAVEERGERASDALVLADTARAVGEDGLAYRVEKELLERDALNVRRAPGLLEEIARRENEAAADAAARRLAGYSDHPPILVRAAEAEFRAGRADAARACVDRLAVAAPGHPAIARLRERLAGAGAR
ncbi:MAG: VWA domain-containing protein [Planctomycetes bacterium]|nr:VWA domain-containing protein [Planctomycetota bacterium]